MASSSQSVAINYGRAGLNSASGMTETLAADTWFPLVEKRKHCDACP